MAEKEVIVENLTKKYGNTIAVNNMSFEVEKGEFFGIIGPSPSGKSTLLNLLMGLEEPTSGKIVIDGQDMSGVPPHKRNISLMFQTYALFPHMNVYDNVAFGLRMRGYAESDIRYKVMEVIELVGLESLEKRYIRQLSGGQQQRVALARSLVLKPRVLLLDEPLGNLDYKLQKKLELEIKLLHQKLGITFVYVTHDQDQAMSLSTRLMVINQGIIEQIGSPGEVYSDPKSVFVAKFVGEANMLSGDIVSIDKDFATVKTEVGIFQGSIRKEELSSKKITYALRPENIFMEHQAEGFTNRISAKYLETLYKGQEAEYAFQLADGTEFKVVKVGKQMVDLKANIGDLVTLGWDSNSAILLDKQSALSS